MHTVGSDVGFLDQVDDNDLALKLAARRAEIGAGPFTEQSVLERRRELRAAAHLLGLAASFQSAHAQAEPSPSPVWLVLSARREEFFTAVGLGATEAGATQARLYGQVADEIMLAGSHLDVCQRCMIGDVIAFNAMLGRVLSNDAHGQGDTQAPK